MSEGEKYNQEITSPPKIGWGELLIHIMSALLIVAYLVVGLIWLFTEKDISRITASSPIIGTIFSIFLILFVFFFWSIFLSVGSFFMRGVINKKGIALPYQVSTFLVLLRSDLIASFFANLFSLLIMLIGVELRKNGLETYSSVGEVVSAFVCLAAWYPSLRYVLTKAKIYQPGFIKSYVWMWCKWVGFPPLAFACAIIILRGVR